MTNKKKGFSNELCESTYKQIRYGEFKIYHKGYKMKNFILRFVFIGILGASSLLAEESGWFAGAQFSSGSVELEYEYCNQASNTKECTADPQEQPFEGYQWGLLGGYKQFFTPKFGLRYYASFNVGKNYSYEGTRYKDAERNEIRNTFTNKLDEYTFHLHIDALYNFITSERSDFGVFAGVGLGYAFYKYTMGDSLMGMDAYIDTARDFDISIFLGLRVNLAKRHGIELYSRFTSLLTQEETFAAVGQVNDSPIRYDLTGIVISNAPKTTIGVRYIFSF